MKIKKDLIQKHMTDAQKIRLHDYLRYETFFLINNIKICCRKSAYKLKFFVFN